MMNHSRTAIYCSSHFGYSEIVLVSLLQEVTPTFLPKRPLRMHVMNVPCRMVLRLCTMDVRKRVKNQLVTKDIVRIARRLNELGKDFNADFSSNLKSVKATNISHLRLLDSA